jgi:hypothetical protein
VGSAVGKRGFWPCRVPKQGQSLPPPPPPPPPDPGPGSRAQCLPFPGLSPSGRVITPVRPSPLPLHDCMHAQWCCWARGVSVGRGLSRWVRGCRRRPPPDKGGGGGGEGVGGVNANPARARPRRRALCFIPACRLLQATMDVYGVCGRAHGRARRRTFGCGVLRPPPPPTLSERLGLHFCRPSRCGGC